MSIGNGLSDRLNGAFEAIDEAGLGLGTWTRALKHVRDLTGSRVGQLTLIGGAAGERLPWTSVGDPDDLRELVEVGGADLRINSRRRIGHHAPLMRVLDERDFSTEEDRHRRPAYGDYLQRRDYPYVCLVPVARSPESTVALSITRGAAQGAVSAEERRVFTALAHRVRQAVKTQEVLGARTLDLLVGSLDHLSQTVFACARDRRVLACTPSAEALLAEGDRLMLVSGRLTARSRQAAGWLASAIGDAGSDGGPPAAPAIATDPEGERPLVLEVTPLPERSMDVWNPATVLVIVRELDAAVGATRLARRGAATMGFTPAEEAVARDLLAGRSPVETAEALGVAVGTVRVHIRNIYAKTGVNNQLAFAALMGALR